MLFAILTCTDSGCEATYEAWGEPDDLESLTCELCGCSLQAVAFSDASASRTSAHGGLELQLRDAA
jgi:hypothetical protein